LLSLLTWITAIGFVLFARGVSPIDSFIAVVIVLLQLPLGALIWLKVQTQRQHDWPTMIGASLGLGSVVVVVLDQLLVNVFEISRVGAIAPGLAALPFAVVATRRATISRTSPDDVSQVLAAVASALMLFGWGGADPSMVYGAFVLTVAALLVAHQASRRRQQSMLYPLMLACGALIVAFAIMRTQQHVPELIPRVLRDLYFGSDDQIKSEQLSYSLATRGLFSNAAAIDLPIKFHWMSLAWVGAMTTASGAEPFLYTLHLAPLAAITALGMLASHVVRRTSNHRWLAVAAPFLVVVVANPDGTIRNAFALTSSNVIPLLWIGLLFVVMLQLDQICQVDRLSWNIVLIAVLPSVVILGKGPYGATIAVGLVLACVSVLALPKYRRNRTPLCVALVGAIALQGGVYLAFLRSDLTDRFDLRIVWSRFPYPLPFRYSPSPDFVEIMFGLLVAVSFVALRYGPILTQGLRQLLQVPGSFVLGCAFGGIVSFLVSQSDGTILGSETYFVNAAVAVVAMFGLTASLTSSAVRRAMASALLASFVYVVIRLVTDLQATTSGLFVFGSVLALLAAGIAVPRLAAGERLAAFCLSLLVSSAAFGVINTPWNLKSHPAPNRVVSSADLEVFDWVRRETPKDAVFVTNRELCAVTVTCGFSGMPTATAFTQRAFVIEGLRTLTPAALWNEQVPERLMPFVTESRAYTEWALSKGQRPKTVRQAGWVLVYSDTQLPPPHTQALQERYRSTDNRIYVLEIVP